MGFFSLFRSKDPENLARELVASALDLELGPEEVRWADSLGVEMSRFIAERNALRVGMTLAGVALALGTTRHTSSPGYKLEVAVNRQFEHHFMAMPNVTADEGRSLYRALASHYIVKPPEEMAGIFHFALFHPEAWFDHETKSTPSYDIPDGFQSFVHALMRQPLKKALDMTKGLGE